MSPFKIIFLACVLACAPIACLTTGCNTTQQTQAFNSLLITHTFVTASYKGFLDGVIAGKVSTNNVREVSQRYNQFQRASVVALDAVQYSPTAPTPANIATMSSNVLALIESATKK